VILHRELPQQSNSTFARRRKGNSAFDYDYVGRKAVRRRRLYPHSQEFYSELRVCQSFGHGDVILKNGDIVPVGRAYYVGGIEKYMNRVKLRGAKTIKH
jgi:hypothetical protein